MAIFAVRPNLLVHDLGASLRFYAETLGFHVGWHWSDRRQRFFENPVVQADPGEPGTALVGRDKAQVLLTQHAEAAPTWLNFDLDTAVEVDSLYQEWLDGGASIAEPPVLRAWGMYEMRLRDPDRNVLRFSAPPSP